ncbi:CHASE2 domain-containing protein [Paenibacillus chartarius]|uniref:CHASE2 domain-containing protein n=1 Tax=Paenibacillus chartarius TaxID=747481 RepID=A0ABV6DME3_9BACL
MKRSQLRTIWIGNIIAVFLLFVILITDSIKVLDYNLYDYDMESTMSGQPHEDIIVIGIDDKDIAGIGTFPWDRDVYIPLLKKLAGAKAVVFDITFASRSKDQSHDKAFADELKNHKNVIIPIVSKTDTELTNVVRYDADGYPLVYELNKAIPEIFEASIPGHINRIEDSDTGIREAWSAIKAVDKDGKATVYPSLSVQAVKLAGGNVDPYLNNDGKKLFNIKYDGASKDFLTMSFSNAVSDKVKPETFKDRIVLIGMTAASDDQGKTPVDTQMYLVYAHANMISQMLKGQHVTEGPDWLENVLIPLLAFLLTVLLTWRLRAISGVVYAVGSAIVLIAAQYVLFSATNTYISVIYGVAALLVAFLVNIAIKTYYESKQKNFITKQFGRYISPELVKEIAKSDQELQLGGINKELSILFLDIRGFTTLSEKLKPEEVVDFLNTMFNMITEKALQNHGTIDKFIGDAAMILFNAPLDVPNHPYYAVKTAWDIQQGMIQVREQIQQRHGVTVSCGIGINTGEVVVGNIGSYLRVDYTAIGDNVNTAARIESQTTANQILISEVTYELVKDYFETNFVAEKMMKGKTVAIKLYEVLGHKSAPAEAGQPMVS